MLDLKGGFPNIQPVAFYLLTFSLTFVERNVDSHSNAQQAKKNKLLE